MYDINVDMTQFRNKWEFYTDNIRWAENIQRCNGKISGTFESDYESYIKWLNEFNIFYTASYRK